MKATVIDDITAALAVDPEESVQLQRNLERFEHLFGVDEDAYEQPTVTRKERYAYYAYYNGDNGVGPISYSQALYASISL